LQVGNGFVGAAGPVNPTDCSLATPFNLTNGMLSSGGELISTDPGVAYQPFWTNPTVGAITTTFAFQDGVLVWYNPSFTNVNAEFCQDLSGQVYTVFDGTTPPFQCTPVAFIPFYSKFRLHTPPFFSHITNPPSSASQCDDGTIVTSAPSSSSTATSASTAGPTACSTGSCLGNGTLTLPAGTFFNDAVPATARPVAECYVRNETWVSGQTTLLPRTA
jgi:hypothetical protein